MIGALRARWRIGRVRVLSKGLRVCNSWHRGPEPWPHLPIAIDPGSLLVMNHHMTRLPPDGHVYLTNTHGYHAALDGGETRRIHLVAVPIG